jgi:hypothetical protein
MREAFDAALERADLLALFKPKPEIPRQMRAVL